jgi:hypothetical protein
LKALFDEEPGDKRLMHLYYKEGEDYTCYVSGSNVVTPGTFTTVLPPDPKAQSSTGLAIKNIWAKTLMWLIIDRV